MHFDYWSLFKSPFLFQIPVDTVPWTKPDERLWILALIGKYETLDKLQLNICAFSSRVLKSLTFVLLIIKKDAWFQKLLICPILIWLVSVLNLCVEISLYLCSSTYCYFAIESLLLTCFVIDFNFLSSCINL